MGSVGNSVVWKAVALSLNNLASQVLVLVLVGCIGGIRLIRLSFVYNIALKIDFKSLFVRKLF